MYKNLAEEPLYFRVPKQVSEEGASLIRKESDSGAWARIHNWVRHDPFSGMVTSTNPAENALV